MLKARNLHLEFKHRVSTSSRIDHTRTSCETSKKKATRSTLDYFALDIAKSHSVILKTCRASFLGFETDQRKRVSAFCQTFRLLKIQFSEEI